MLRASHTLSAIVLASLAALAAPAHAQFGGGGGSPITVTGTGTDLVDAVLGQDLWQFDFTITGQMATNSVYKMGLDARFGNPINLSVGDIGQFGVAIVSDLLTGNLEYRFTDMGTTSATNSFSFRATRVANPVGVPGPLLPSSVATVFGSYTPQGGATAFSNATLTMGAALAPVPEASTAAMLFAGLAAMGFMVRRRRQG